MKKQAGWPIKLARGGTIEITDEELERYKACEQIVLQMYVWWIEGDAPLHASALILNDDSTLKEAVCRAIERR